jgi:hypothetical protein
MMEIWRKKDTVSVSESKFLKHKIIIVLTNIAICKNNCIINITEMLMNIRIFSMSTIPCVQLELLC